MRRGKLLLIGLLMYLASFWLVAVGFFHDSDTGARGFVCAYTTLVEYPWVAAKTDAAQLSNSPCLPCMRRTPDSGAIASDQRVS